MLVGARLQHPLRGYEQGRRCRYDAYRAYQRCGMGVDVVCGSADVVAARESIYRERDYGLPLLNLLHVVVHLLNVVRAAAEGVDNQYHRLDPVVVVGAQQKLRVVVCVLACEYVALNLDDRNRASEPPVREERRERGHRESNHQQR